MKRKLEIIALLFGCCCLIACNAKSNDNNNTTYGEVTFSADEDESKIDIAQIEQAFIDEYIGQKDSSKCVQKIIERLGSNGYIAIDSENRIDMTNADEMKQFISIQESGKQAEICVFQIFYSGGVNILSINADEGNINIIQQYYAFQDGHLVEGAKSEFEATYFEYTDEGYLMIEGSYNSPDLYVLTMSEEEEHIALRVEPLDEECRKLCEKYLKPISYGMNNMFITNWNEDDYGNLDFYDIFERFYKETYGISCPYTMNDDLSVGNEYEIPAEEFENVIMQYFRIGAKELHRLLRYDSDKNVYLYRPRGYEEHDYAEVPYPEVVAYKKNDEGSLTLTVNAVYPNDNASKLFSTKVTVIEDNGKKYYLSNEIPGDEELNLWWHADRLTDDEWSECYKGGDEPSDDYSWLIPQADHENFTADEKKKLESDTLTIAANIWELYDNVTIDESSNSFNC
ncbi:MAG: DUF6070 family protein [Lachnospiraceae bacterium]|nr:DUF6070 family protein [Lachnospiraceae bacterium]MDO4965210.1 DUF6070 family protein [Lachnospiraceae bacterium]